MLDAPSRGDMHFFVVFNQFEGWAKFTVQRIRDVLDHRKATPLGRAVRSKGGDYDVPARLHRALDLSDIRATVGLVREKVKYGPVVPDVKEPVRQWRGGNVRLDPLHKLRFLPEPSAGHGQRFIGEIQPIQIAVAVSDQVIRQRRCTTTYVDDCGIRADADPLNQI
jgi:hypothetical protein